MSEPVPHVCEVTRNDNVIEVSYESVIIDIAGSESASVKATWVDNLGQSQTERIHLTFPGNAADTLREQILAGIDARLQAKFGA